MTDDYAEWLRRNMELNKELRKHPRRLTPEERWLLRDTVAPVLDDLAATGMMLPDILEEAHEDRGVDAVYGWVLEPDGMGCSIQILKGVSLADQVAMLAEQIQELVADRLDDSGLSIQWPRCPEHPSDRRHRLVAEVREASAVWTCLESGNVICTIGSLPAWRDGGAVAW